MAQIQDEVVISGVGGFFPKATNLEKLKEVLLSNEVLLETRWKEGERGVSNRIGICPSIEFFDTAFFGIHRQQATFMDPMQRLILERTFEALVDAGVNPLDIRGKRIGCFMGSSIGENDNLFYESIVSGFGVTGHSRAMMSNRVSYWLNLKGPSCAYDSNWINGIEVLQMAFDAVREGHCEAAIIGTANLALNSELSWLYNDMGLISDDGSNKSFDAEAKGYARSDGVVVMYIQRAVDAKRSYATIVNTSTLFNGAREGTLLDVDQPSMVNFLEDFYKKCDVNPKDVDIVECYGSAIKKIDEAELNAIDEVYCKNRSKPLMIGCVKTNAGHSEASSTLTAIAKIIIAMETETIPATLQYTNPNPNIEGLVKGRLEVVTENRKWSGGYAAVNGIGLSSSYAHVLLKSNFKKKVIAEDNLPRLAIGSTRTEAGIEQLLETIKNQPTLDNEYICLTQEVFSKTIQGHLYRGYSVLDKEGEIKREFEYHSGNKRQTWFVFSGMGSQWAGMAADLMCLPIFANSIMASHNTLVPFGLDLLKIVTDPDPATFDNILHSFVGIAAVQIALTDIIKALGIIPDGIIGHSVGELGCAYSDDCVSAEQMIMCAYSRGKASLEAVLIKGMMAAVGLGYQQIKDQIPETIEVACHNGPDSSTISGPTEDMEVFVKQLQDKGVFARLVNVANIAYHSRYIKPAAPGLLKYLKEVIPVPKDRSSKWISTSIAENKWDSELAKTSSAEYHTNNLLSSVLFEEGSKHIPKDSIVIEIAPHGLLQAILKRSLKSGCTNIPLTQRGSKNGMHFLLGAIGKMYLAGLDLNLSAIFPKIDFPVGVGTVGLAPLVDWEHGEVWRTGLEDKLNYLISVKDLQISLTSNEYRECVGHQLDEQIIIPLSTYMVILIRILSTSTSKEVTDVVFENMRFRNVITIPKIGSVPLYAMIQKGSGDFEVLSGNEIIASGRVTVPQTSEKFMVDTQDLEKHESDIQLTGNDIYSEFSHRGHKYSGNYKAIKNVTITKTGSIAAMPAKKTWQMYIEGMLQQFLFQYGEKYQDVMVPSTIQRIALSMSNIPTDDNDVELNYEFATGTSTIQGLQLGGITTCGMTKNSMQLSFDSLELMSLRGCPCETIENAINYSLHLTINNFKDVITNNIVITEIVKNQPSIAENIKTVTDKYMQMNVNFTSVTDPKLMIVVQTDPILLITNDEVQNETITSIASADVFVLCRASKYILSLQQVTIFAQFDVKGISYVLLRKVHDITPKIVKVKNDTLTSKDLTKASLSWVAELNENVKNIKPKEMVYLVSNIVPTEGIMNFVQDIRSNKEWENLRFVFTMDKKCPEFTASDKMYQELIKQDNIVTVIKNGILGTYVPISIDFKSNIKNDQQISSNLVTNQAIHYIAINSNDETINKTAGSIVGLGNIDYVATTTDKKRVMGLARLDQDSYDLKPDSTLQWQLPESWSMEDGCTIPHAYATAYHCLVQKAQLKSGEVVLIHGGCSAIGLASIGVAIAAGCTVYTTVATDWQRSFLKKTFSNLRDRNILNSENTSFEPHLLLATGGDGADVIVNCVCAHLLHATIRCIAEFGRIVQLGKFNMTENNTIGMSLFLKNTSFIGVTPENLFGNSQEDKIELQKLVQDGINKFVVRPLFRKVVEHQDIANIITDIQKKNHIGKIMIKITNNLPLNQLNLNKPNQFICDSKSSQLVYGGTSEVWIDMVEWLVLRGARKIIVASDSKSQQNYVNRRISLLKKYFKAEIIYTPNKIQTKDNASELLSELYLLGPIQSVYILPTKHIIRTADIKPVQYIESALKTTAPKALFVNFLSAAAGVCQLRSDIGFPTFNVRWDTSLDFTDVLSSLDDVLSFKTVNIIIKNDKSSDSDQETTQALFKKLTLLLPLSGQEIVKQAEIMPTEPELIQLPSNGPRRIRELPPVFIVPGLSGHETIKEFARNLLYPMFYTNIPSVHFTISEMAKIFAEKMKNLFPKGPYNIVGISWGGALAIEISKILQKTANIQLTLIDGAPDTIQAALKHLGEGVNYEVNLLTRVLNITNTEFLKSLSSLPSWDRRLSAALKAQDGTEEDKEILTRSLTLLKKQLDDIIVYGASDVIVPGTLHLIRPSGSSKYDNCGLSKYCKEAPLIHISAGDHISILKAKSTISMVNEKVAVI